MKRREGSVTVGSWRGARAIGSLDYILRHKDKSAMSEGEMESNAALILPAGTKIISTTMSGTLYLLSRYPDVLINLAF